MLRSADPRTPLKTGLHLCAEDFIPLLELDVTINLFLRGTEEPVSQRWTTRDGFQARPPILSGGTLVLLEMRSRDLKEGYG